MTVSASSSNFTRAIYTADSTPDLALPTTVPAGATIVVGVKNRTDTTTDCTSVTDSNGATYTKASESTATTESAFWYTNNSAGGTVTVTVTWAGAVNSQVAAGWISSDAGPLQYDAVATVREAGSNETTVNSNTVAATAAGCIIGFAGCNNTQSDPEPTANGAGESELLAGLSGLRVGMFFEAYASAGTYGFETTWDSATSQFHVLALKESSGVSVTSVNDTTLYNGQTGIVITGTGFGASQGAGTVKICPTDNVADGSAVSQTVTAWSDTSITFTASRGSLSYDTPLYLFVTSNGGSSNASGYSVSFYDIAAGLAVLQRRATFVIDTIIQY